MPTQELPRDYERHLDDLKEHVEFVSKGTPGHEDNVQALNILREMHDNRCHSKDGEYHVSFGWLYRVTDNFLERLQQREHTPMIIYAYFVVLVCSLEPFWYRRDLYLASAASGALSSWLLRITSAKMRRRP